MDRQNAKRLPDFNRQVWEYAESAWHEYRALAVYCQLLGGEGFEAEEGSGDMPMAFVARRSRGSRGPKLGTYAEPRSDVWRGDRPVDAG